MIPAGNYPNVAETPNRRGTACALLMVLLMTAVSSGAAVGRDSGWHRQTKHYSVYLGVVPVRLLKEQPKLVDMDKTLHGGLMQEPDTQHLTVAVFDAKTEQRVTDATVIAEVRHKRRIDRKTIERPLERMYVGGVVSYGNFFPMAEHGDYEINLKIYVTPSEGPETVKFVYKKPE